jgi:hypothetical protein
MGLLLKRSHPSYNRSNPYISDEIRSFVAVNSESIKKSGARRKSLIWKGKECSNRTFPHRNVSGLHDFGCRLIGRPADLKGGSSSAPRALDGLLIYLVMHDHDCMAPAVFLP